MSLYIYKKAGYEEAQENDSFPTNPSPPTAPPSPIATPPHSTFQVFPIITSIIGLVLITFVVWPIFSYEIISSNETTFTNTGLLNPLALQAPVTALIATPKIVSSVDYTQAGNWFPQAQPSQINKIIGPETYTLSIPKLRINKATVVIGSNDLSKNLIHYAETALPGQYGSPVIFGHSILPQFYNPTNYISIFSLLPTLNKGDEIIVDYDNVTYTYKITEKQEVLPEDLWVLAQQYDAKKIKLITCVPPGLKTKRLVVTGELSRT